MYNFHTHTHYCDGLAEPEEFVEEALRKKMKVLGFSAHASVPFDNPWSLKDENAQEYFDKIKSLKKAYKHNIQIFNALEVDYIPGISTPFATLKKQWALDYIIGAVHLVKKNNELWFIDGPEANFIGGVQNIFNGDIREAVSSYYNQINEMLYKEKPDIIAHFDKIKMHNKNRFFSEDDKWYEQITEKTLDVIARQETIVEVNTRGIYTGKCETFFPGVPILEKCLKKGIPVMINCDAHKPEDLLEHYYEASETLKKIGFKKLAILTAEGPEMIDLDKYC